MELANQDSSRRNLSIGWQRNNSSIGHTHVDRFVDGIQSEGTEGRSGGDDAASEEGFDGTESGAAIEGETIAIVTGFGKITDGVAAARDGTVGATSCACRKSILDSGITFLSGFESAIATRTTKEPAGCGITIVGKGRAMERRLTDFIESLLDDAVTAGTAFEETGSGAAVTVSAVTVVAFFGRGEDTITADGGTEDLCGEGTGGTAGIIG